MKQNDDFSKTNPEEYFPHEQLKNENLRDDNINYVKRQQNLNKFDYSKYDNEINQLSEDIHQDSD